VKLVIAGIDAWSQVTIEKNADVAAGPEYAKVFAAAADARSLREGSNVQDWNLATNMVITGNAGAQIMGGDAFYFPKSDDAETEAAQLELASLMLSKEVQVNFNLKKGSLPVRGDVDLSAANDCMKKGLAILAQGNILPDGNQTLSPDTQGQLEDLMTEYLR